MLHNCLREVNQTKGIRAAHFAKRNTNVYLLTWLRRRNLLRRKMKKTKMKHAWPDPSIRVSKGYSHKNEKGCIL